MNQLLISPKKIYNTIVVGLGNIGMMYDYKTSDENIILSHTKAIHNHYGFNLIAGVERSPVKRELFKKKYSKMAYASVEELFKNESNIDVAVISTPSQTHLKFVQELITYKTKNILCEKPMGFNENDSKIISSIIKSKNVTFLVNYIRRFDPEIIKIKKAIKSKKFGNLKNIVVYYSGELWNIASHFINLTQFILEEDFSIENIMVLSKNKEGGMNFYIKLNSGIEINFISCLKVNFEIIDFQIITDKNIITLKNGGRKILIESVVSDNLFKNYKILEQFQIIDNEYLAKCQYNVFDKFYRIINNKDKNISTATVAYQTSKILNKIRIKG